MNVHTITAYVLAVALIAPAVGAIAAEQPVKAGPYTGPDQAVLTTASNAESPRTDGYRAEAMEVTMLSARDAVNPPAIPVRFGRCGTLTFSSDGHGTALSSNQFADPFSIGETAFVCHTY
jgi:hypothetical protein